MLAKAGDSLGSKRAYSQLVGESKSRNCRYRKGGGSSHSRKEEIVRGIYTRLWERHPGPLQKHLLENVESQPSY